MIFEDDVIEIETITMPMEDGTEQEFAILDDFEFEGKTYIVVSMIKDDDIDEDIYIYGYQEDGDDVIIDYIEDDEEYEKVCAAYDELCEAEWEEDEEEEDGEED